MKYVLFCDKTLPPSYLAVLVKPEFEDQSTLDARSWRVSRP